MSNKTISINPSLFSVNGSKTKKNREKKGKPAVPLISPSVLKNKLLKRIKEHKQKETQNLENNKRKLNNEINITPNTSIDYSDEFTESLNYLQSLSKQKTLNEERMKNIKRKEDIERRTIRNYHSSNINVNNPLINIDLPEELIQSNIPISNIPLSNISVPFKQDDVPYGVLKGGLKPSYREWSKTQRNNIVTNPNASLIIEGGISNSQKNARENRLNLLRQKIKNKNEELKADVMLNENLIKKPISQLEINQPNVINTNQSNISLPNTSLFINQQNSGQPNVPSLNNDSQQEGAGKLIGTKHITKKTIKRKYTLGRSQIKKTVGVLIKDRGTRKKVLTAQKDLKRRNINDIKSYLREHNLIKSGSNAPNDVLRKMYESAMLSGEITNSNPETLLHNFSKEDRQI